MAWIAHVVSGALEVVWSSALKLADGVARMGCVAVMLPVMAAGCWPAR